MKRRRLSDLYVKGTELTVNDGQGDGVVVWIAKLNEIERESVIRRGQAARARYMMEADDEDSDVFQAMYATVRSYEDRDVLVRIVIADELRRFRQRVEAETGGDKDTWGKENYLQGLVDSWTGTDEEPGLAATIIEDPEDPEAVKVKAELDRFEAQVMERFEVEVRRVEQDWTDTDDNKLWRSCTHELLRRRSEEAFIKEFERQQIFHAVRERGDHGLRYFSTLGEVDDLDPKVREQIAAAFNTLEVGSHEGKDSPETRDSSPSSEPPAAETPEPSGLVAASA